MEDGARVDVDEYEKDSARDFALWKAAKPGETSWETPIGRGRPGWHIECSAMAMEYLGESFDLHAGGEDLMFPHHENEIAQSESVTHKPFARHWMHVRFLLVDGRKMSKSEGNFYTLRDLLLKGYKASAIRLALISVPYRHQLNFTFDGLDRGHQRHRAAAHLSPAADEGQLSPPGENPDAAGCREDRRKTEYMAALANDLNTAEARAPIFDLIRAANTAIDQGQFFAGDRDAILAVLASFDAVFDVIEDHDAEPTRRALEWAEADRPHGRRCARAAGAAVADRRSDRRAGGRAHPGQEAAQLCPRRPDSQRAGRKGHRDRRLERRRALEAEMTLATATYATEEDTLAMEANEAQELQENAEHGSSESSLRPVAFTMSVLAVLVAVTTVLGHRTHTEAVLDQNKATDQWNQYQAKKIRSNDTSLAADLLSVMTIADKDCRGKNRQGVCRSSSQVGRRPEGRSGKGRGSWKRKSNKPRRAPIASIWPRRCSRLAW